MKRTLEISADLNLPLDVAGEAMAILATRGAGKSYTSAALIEELTAAGVQVVVLDPTGVYWGLRSSADGKQSGLGMFVLGGAHGHVALEPTAGKLIADVIVDTGQSLVLDLSDFETKGAQTRFVTDLIERLYQRKARARTTLHLVVDEANEFAPQRPMRDEPRMLGAMERLVGKGRSRGIGVTLVSQRSAAINKNVLDLIDTLIAMRTLGPRDRKAIRDWVEVKQADDEVGVVESLPSLPTGTAWVWSPVRDILAKAQIRRIATFDSYATPKPGEKRIEPTATTPLDVDALGEQMRATAERAKADDPKELRKEVARLKAELARKPIEVERVVERTIEVPVVDQQVLDHLEAVGKLIAEASAALPKAMGQLDMAATRISVNAGEPEEKRPPADVIPIRPPTAERTSPDKQDKKRPGFQSDGSFVYELATQEKAVLGVLAQYPSGRSKQQIAMLAGYSPTSGAFGQALANLRKMELIEGGSTLFTITERGRAEVGNDYDPLPSGEALREYWIGKRPSQEGKILRALIDAYPSTLSKAEIAERVGYRVTSGAFGQALANLRKLDIITGGSAAYSASEDLFQ